MSRSASYQRQTHPRLSHGQSTFISPPQHNNHHSSNNTTQSRSNHTLHNFPPLSPTGQQRQQQQQRIWSPRVAQPAWAGKIMVPDHQKLIHQSILPLSSSSISPPFPLHSPLYPFSLLPHSNIPGISGLRPRSTKYRIEMMTIDVPIKPIKISRVYDQIKPILSTDNHSSLMTNPPIIDQNAIVAISTDDLIHNTPTHTSRTTQTPLTMISFQHRELYPEQPPLRSEIMTPLLGQSIKQPKNQPTSPTMVAVPNHPMLYSLHLQQDNMTDPFQLLKLMPSCMADEFITAESSIHPDGPDEIGQNGIHLDIFQLPHQDPFVEVILPLHSCDYNGSFTPNKIENYTDLKLKFFQPTLDPIQLPLFPPPLEIIPGVGHIQTSFSEPRYQPIPIGYEKYITPGVKIDVLIDIYGNNTTTAPISINTTNLNLCRDIDNQYGVMNDGHTDEKTITRSAKYLGDIAHASSNNSHLIDINCHIVPMDNFDYIPSPRLESGLENYQESATSSHIIFQQHSDKPFPQYPKLHQGHQPQSQPWWLQTSINYSQSIANISSDIFSACPFSSDISLGSSQNLTKAVMNVATHNTNNTVRDRALSTAWGLSELSPTSKSCSQTFLKMVEVTDSLYRRALDTEDDNSGAKAITESRLLTQNNIDTVFNKFKTKVFDLYSLASQPICPIPLTDWTIVEIPPLMGHLAGPKQRDLLVKLSYPPGQVPIRIDFDDSTHTHVDDSIIEIDTEIIRNRSRDGKDKSLSSNGIHNNYNSPLHNFDVFDLQSQPNDHYNSYNSGNITATNDHTNDLDHIDDVTTSNPLLATTTTLIPAPFIPPFTVPISTPSSQTLISSMTNVVPTISTFDLLFSDHAQLRFAVRDWFWNDKLDSNSPTDIMNSPAQTTQHRQSHLSSQLVPPSHPFSPPMARGTVIDINQLFSSNLVNTIQPISFGYNTTWSNLLRAHQPSSSELSSSTGRKLGFSVSNSKKITTIDLVNNNGSSIDLTNSTEVFFDEINASPAKSNNSASMISSNPTKNIVPFQVCSIPLTTHMANLIEAFAKNKSDTIGQFDDPNGLQFVLPSQPRPLAFSVPAFILKPFQDRDLSTDAAFEPNTAPKNTMIDNTLSPTAHSVRSQLQKTPQNQHSNQTTITPLSTQDCLPTSSQVPQSQTASQFNSPIERQPSNHQSTIPLDLDTRAIISPSLESLAHHFITSTRTSTTDQHFTYPGSHLSSLSPSLISLLQLSFCPNDNNFNNPAPFLSAGKSSSPTHLTDTLPDQYLTPYQEIPHHDPVILIEHLFQQSRCGEEFAGIFNSQTNDDYDDDHSIHHVNNRSRRSHYPDSDNDHIDMPHHNNKITAQKTGAITTQVLLSLPIGTISTLLDYGLPELPQIGFMMYRFLSQDFKKNITRNQIPNYPKLPPPQPIQIGPTLYPFLPQNPAKRTLSAAIRGNHDGHDGTGSSEQTNTEHITIDFIINFQHVRNRSMGYNQSNQPPLPLEDDTSDAKTGDTDPGAPPNSQIRGTNAIINAQANGISQFWTLSQSSPDLSAITLILTQALPLFSLLSFFPQSLNEISQRSQTLLYGLQLAAQNGQDLQSHLRQLYQLEMAMSLFLILFENDWSKLEHLSANFFNSSQSNHSVKIHSGLNTPGAAITKTQNSDNQTLRLQTKKENCGPSRHHPSDNQLPQTLGICFDALIPHPKANTNLLTTNCSNNNTCTFSTGINITQPPQPPPPIQQPQSYSDVYHYQQQQQHQQQQFSPRTCLLCCLSSSIPINNNQRNKLPTQSLYNRNNNNNALDPSSTQTTCQCVYTNLIRSISNLFLIIQPIITMKQGLENLLAAGQRLAFDMGSDNQTDTTLPHFRSNINQQYHHQQHNHHQQQYFNQHNEMVMAHISSFWSELPSTNSQHPPAFNQSHQHSHPYPQLELNQPVWNTNQHLQQQYASRPNHQFQFDISNIALLHYLITTYNLYSTSKICSLLRTVCCCNCFEQHNKGALEDIALLNEAIVVRNILDFIVVPDQPPQTLPAQPVHEPTPLDNHSTQHQLPPQQQYHYNNKFQQFSRNKELGIQPIGYQLPPPQNTFQHQNQQLPQQPLGPQSAQATSQPQLKPKYDLGQFVSQLAPAAFRYRLVHIIFTLPDPPLITEPIGRTVVDYAYMDRLMDAYYGFQETILKCISLHFPVEINTYLLPIVHIVPKINQILTSNGYYPFLEREDITKSFITDSDSIQATMADTENMANSYPSSRHHQHNRRHCCYSSKGIIDTQSTQHNLSTGNLCCVQTGNELSAANHAFINPSLLSTSYSIPSIVGLYDHIASNQILTSTFSGQNLLLILGGGGSGRGNNNNRNNSPDSHASPHRRNSSKSDQQQSSHDNDGENDARDSTRTSIIKADTSSDDVD